MSAKKIPDGMQGRVVPHLVVENAAEAIEFYKKAFDAVESTRSLAPDGKRLMHAALQVGDSTLFLCDDFPEYGKARSPKALGGSPVTIHQYVENCDAAIDKARAAGAVVKMEATDMFWGDRYGTVTDPYGHDWSFATHVRDVTPEEMAAEAKKMFSKG
jgi:uncharacterized glyoxalase superfamily protein PhnB